MKPYTKLRQYSPLSLESAGLPPGSNRTEPTAASIDSPGLFETLRIVSGRPVWCARHYRRLAQGCQVLAKSPPMDERAFRELILEGVRESGYTEAMARMALCWERQGQCEASLILRPYAGPVAHKIESGVQIRTVAGRRGPAHGQDWKLKSSDYVSGVLAHLDTDLADGTDGVERLFLTPAGEVSETTVANVFIVRGKSLLTPWPASGILVGVTRSAVLESAPRLGLIPLETALTRHDLYTAEECFLTNASCEALPAVRVDGRVIGAGVPGPRARQFLQYFERLRSQTDD